ncbi:MAG: hypothetical protein ABJP48_01385 [Erythrobacter sp.]
MRISSLISLATLVSSCGSVSEEAPGKDINCAIGAGADYANVCTLEKVENADGAFFLLHHPDGGFRRVKMDKQTGKLTVQDGADELQDRTVEANGAKEFEIAGDRYVIPMELLAGPVE